MLMTRYQPQLVITITAAVTGPPPPDYLGRVWVVLIHTSPQGAALLLYYPGLSFGARDRRCAREAEPNTALIPPFGGTDVSSNCSEIPI